MLPKLRVRKRRLMGTRDNPATVRPYSPGGSDSRYVPSSPAPLPSNPSHIPDSGAGPAGNPFLARLEASLSDDGRLLLRFREVAQVGLFRWSGAQPYR